MKVFFFKNYRNNQTGETVRVASVNGNNTELTTTKGDKMSFDSFLESHTLTSYVPKFWFD